MGNILFMRLHGFERFLKDRGCAIASRRSKGLLLLEVRMLKQQTNAVKQHSRRPKDTDYDIREVEKCVGRKEPMTLSLGRQRTVFHIISLPCVTPFKMAFSKSSNFMLLVKRILYSSSFTIDKEPYSSSETWGWEFIFLHN
ncbi:uncharacterized protein [Struthio camelus]|uniref:uncharacterized protein isoform X2 n=1 Tax=Struthio camelus TaxID=8801 RepID=UPI003603DD72